MDKVVILGAGFGGLELASRLSDEVPDAVDVTLIDKNDAFVFGYSKLDVMFGRHSLDAVRMPYRDIVKPSVTFRQETVVAIDPEQRRVTTDRATYDADVLVVALGADLAPEATPGLLDDGHDFYSVNGAAAARDVIAAFPGGNAVISILGPFFKCPAAPYETAMMLHDALEHSGVRANSSIRVLTPMQVPIPISRGRVGRHPGWPRRARHRVLARIGRHESRSGNARRHLARRSHTLVRPVPRRAGALRATGGGGVGACGRRLDPRGPGHIRDTFSRCVRSGRRHERARAARRRDRRR